MAYPNAPDSLLLRTVPEVLTFLRYLSPNQDRGPTAIPILHKGFVEYAKKVWICLGLT